MTPLFRPPPIGFEAVAVATGKGPLPVASRVPRMTHRETRPMGSYADTTPATTVGARWIISERSGRWAIGLRREADSLRTPHASHEEIRHAERAEYGNGTGRSGIRLHETRSLADGWAMLEQFPSSFLVAELTRDNVQSLLQRMAGLERSLPLARVAVVADRSLADYHWLMLEAGAAWFAVSPRDLRPIAALAARHLRLAPARGGDLVQQVWNSLPWEPAGECKVAGTLRVP